MYTISLNTEQLDAALMRLASGLADMSPVMRQIGRYLQESTKTRFQKGVAPSGAPWAPKKQTTIDAYNRRNQTVDPRPLFGPSGDLHEEIFYQTGPDFVEIGSSVIYAAAMQFGKAQGTSGRTSRNGPIPWGNIPARPFIGVSEADERQIVDIISEYLEGTTLGAP